MRAGGLPGHGGHVPPGLLSGLEAWMGERFMVNLI